MKTHKKSDCRFSHGIAVLVIDACNVLQAERPCWFWCSIWLYRNACNLGWAGCHVAKDPKLWAACVWLWLLGHAGAAPLQERPCEELAWGWLAVVVQWCCQGIEWCDGLSMLLGMWQCPCCPPPTWKRSQCDLRHVKHKYKPLWAGQCGCSQHRLACGFIFTMGKTKIASFSAMIIFIVLM